MGGEGYALAEGGEGGDEFEDAEEDEEESWIGERGTDEDEADDGVAGESIPLIFLFLGLVVVEVDGGEVLLDI